MRTMKPDGLNVANVTVEKWEEETKSMYVKYDEAEMREICGDTDPIAFLAKQVRYSQYETGIEEEVCWAAVELSLIHI